MSLAGLNILVTRPKGQASSLLAAINAAQGAGFHYPVMDIKALQPEQDPKQWQQCKQLVMALDEFHHVIFISTNAVKFGLEWISQYWPQLPVGIQWHAIGSSTAKELVKQGVPLADEDLLDKTSYQSAMNSEALLEHQTLQQLADKKVLIVRGVNGREFLAEQLSQRGAAVSYAQCYRRAIVNRPVGELATVMAQHTIDVVCANSLESLQHIIALVGEAALPVLQQKLLVVPSERVSIAAGQLGFKQIITAVNASDSAMLAALLTNKP